MKIPRRISKIFERRGGLPPARLRHVKDYIHSHLDENLSLRKLAELAQMSPYHFGRLFKQSTGLSPHQYVLRQRIAKGRELLGDEHLSIAEISSQLGFASQSHFTTVFRNLAGTTPNHYRQKKDGSWGLLDSSLIMAII